MDVCRLITLMHKNKDIDYIVKNMFNWPKDTYNKWINTLAKAEEISYSRPPRYIWQLGLRWPYIPIISISGGEGAGKDTAGKILIANGFIRVAFASLLKDFVSKLFNLDRSLLEGDTEISRKWREEYLEKIDCSPRELLIRVAKDMREATIENNYTTPFVLYAKKKIKNILSSGHRVVVTDLINKDEYDMLKQYSALFIKIEREGAPIKHDFSVIKYDEIIYNRDRDKFEKDILSLISD